MLTSSCSSGRNRERLSNVRVASANWAPVRPVEPLKMTSVIYFPRRLRALWSPRIHLIESTTLLLPLPFGPTTPVIPAENSKTVLSAKLLKPKSSSDLSIEQFPRQPQQIAELPQSLSKCYLTAKPQRLANGLVKNDFSLAVGPAFNLDKSTSSTDVSSSSAACMSSAGDCSSNERSSDSVSPVVD